MVHAVLIAAISLGGFVAAYYVYGKFLAHKIFELTGEDPTPAELKNDGQEFVPTNRFVLFGHHFASIAGLGPILGPAIAVIWGWLPALLWVFFGSILLGAVHDLSSLAISMRHEGRSIGDITTNIIGPRAQRLFLLVIFFALALAMGVFALVIAILFTQFHPEAVLPTMALIVVAVVMGVLVYKVGVPLLYATIGGLALIFLALVIGIEHPVAIYQFFLPQESWQRIQNLEQQGTFEKLCYVTDFGGAKEEKLRQESENTGNIFTRDKIAEVNQKLREQKQVEISTQEFSSANIRTMVMFFKEQQQQGMVDKLQKAQNSSYQVWIWGLLLYALVASVLPVWLLLQPRDYLNSFQLYIGCGLMYLGLFIALPMVVAPALNPQTNLFTVHPDTQVPGLFPFLFITVACGAISGFHCLVSSGTTVRQLKKEKDALFIGYGGMLTEGALAVGVILACTAGFASEESWNYFYRNWQAASGLGAKLAAFVNGAGVFISEVGIPLAFAKAMIAVLVVGFAMTTLDSATRLLRYNVEELGRNLQLKPLENRFLATFLAVLAIAFFALLKIDGQPAGMILWELFGTTNQLLGGMALLVATIYLYKKGKPIIYTLLPMLFMLVMTLTAMCLKEWHFFQEGNLWLLIVGGIILVMAVWLCIEAWLTIRSLHKR